MRVRYTPRARDDLWRILVEIDAESRQGARSVKQAIQRAIRLIGQYPEAGPLSGVADTRVRPAGRFPYLIYWLVKRDTAWLVHIRHTARKPWEGEQT